MLNIFRVKIRDTKPRHHFGAFINHFELFPQVILVFCQSSVLFSTLNM